MSGWQIVGIAAARQEHVPLARSDGMRNDLRVILPADFPEIFAVLPREQDDLAVYHLRSPGRVLVVGGAHKYLRLTTCGRHT